MRGTIDCQVIFFMQDHPLIKELNFQCFTAIIKHYQMIENWKLKTMMLFQLVKKFRLNFILPFMDCSNDWKCRGFFLTHFLPLQLQLEHRQPPRFACVVQRFANVENLTCFQALPLIQTLHIISEIWNSIKISAQVD